jgi:hypothetical protein
MKLMKVIYTMKNILNQEFEQWKELKVIEVMSQKILLIQFVSIANLIQMKSREVSHNL